MSAVGGGPWRREAGFSLLEVMVALAILAISLTVISESQQASMRQVMRSKMITIATLLAREKMVEIEDQLFEEGFSDFEDEERGDFADQGYKQFEYVLRVEKVELPTSVNPDNLASSIGGSGDEAGAGGMAKVGGQMLAQQFELLRNLLEQSIRRVHLEVSWLEGRTRRKTTVVAFFTDPRKVAQLGIGALLAGGAAGKEGSPDTGTGSSGRTGGSGSSGDRSSGSSRTSGGTTGVTGARR